MHAMNMPPRIVGGRSASHLPVNPEFRLGLNREPVPAQRVPKEMRKMQEPLDELVETAEKAIVSAVQVRFGGSAESIAWL